MKFSERYGYVKPSEAIIRGRITPAIQNAICNCVHWFSDNLMYNHYVVIERYICKPSVKCIFCHHNSLFLGKNKKNEIMIKDAFHRRIT